MRWLRRAIGGLPGNRLLVLAFHRVASAHDPYDPQRASAPLFARQLDALAAFDVVPLDHGLGQLAAGTLQRPSVAITFDDGYRDQLHVAQPMLEERGYPSTVFVCPAFVDGPNLWHDRLLWAFREGQAGRRVKLGDREEVIPPELVARRQLAARCIDRVKSLPLAPREAAVASVEADCGAPSMPRLLLDRAELAELAVRPGVEIGAHTRHHPILATCGNDESREEIAGSRRDLEQVLGRPIRFFAYPNGHEGRDFGSREVAIAREAGYSHAFSSDWGTVRPGMDAWRLPRLGLYHRTTFANTLMLLREVLRR